MSHFHKKEMNIAFPKAGIFEEYVCNDGAAQLGSARTQWFT